MQTKSWVALIVTALFLAGCTSEKPRPSPRVAWQNQAIQRLEGFAPGPETPRAESRIVSIQDTESATYSIAGNLGEALLAFDDSQWLHVLTHSNHIDGEIGDILVAVDQDGVYYNLDAHICGSIRFVAPGQTSFATSTEDFFARFVPWPDRTKTWHRIR